jgi:alkylhydroperoxidase/carboxymuconolactone decarboxylase family protein YurZ
MKDSTDFASKIDAHYRHIWAAYEDHLAGRGVLDERIRRLATIGQCATMGEVDEVESQVRDALAKKSAAPLEMLEAILQARVYVGRPRIDRSLKRFFAVCDEAGIGIESLTRDVGPDGWLAGRKLDEERKRWLIGPDRFPERDTLIDRYGWEGMSIGMMMQPANFPSVITKCDALDPSYAKPWIDVVHAGMYARPILTQQERTLIMIADVVSIGEFMQARFHMTNAVKLGIPPRQVLEICWLSTLYAGMPKLYSAFVFKEVLDELGMRLD